MDRDGSELRKIPLAHKRVSITTLCGDFLKHETWPFAGLDGILMANSLHYVEDQAKFIRACEPRMRSSRSFLIVEYDTCDANRWVPFPLPQARPIRLFNDAGYGSQALALTAVALSARGALRRPDR
jgi:hypothetical protein